MAESSAPPTPDPLSQTLHFWMRCPADQCEALTQVSDRTPLVSLPITAFFSNPTGSWIPNQRARTPPGGGESADEPSLSVKYWVLCRYVWVFHEMAHCYYFYEKSSGYERMVPTATWDLVSHANTGVGPAMFTKLSGPWLHFLWTGWRSGVTQGRTPQDPGPSVWCIEIDDIDSFQVFIE